MLSSEFDAFVPIENARQYFELIGTPAADEETRDRARRALRAPRLADP